MTRIDVQNIPGFHPATLMAAVAYLRENSNTAPASLDATVLVRNEGVMQGIHRAADMLKGIMEKEKPPGEKKQNTLYQSDPFNQQPK
jgi:hypothetical protein